MIREKVGLIIGIALVLVVSVATAGTMKPAWSRQQIFAQMVRHKTTSKRAVGRFPRSFSRRPLATSHQPPATRDGQGAPRLDGEFMIDTNTTLGHGQMSVGSTAEAFDGNNYLVVWEDYSSGIITGTRVTRGGVVIDSAGIRMSAQPSWQTAPDVAFDGTNFLVVWGDWRADGDIYGTRVSRAGVVLDSAGIPISTESNEQSAPALVWNGANYFVVWQDYRDTSGMSDIYGARVTPAGQVLDPAGIPISTARQYQQNPQVDVRGSDHLVVWTDYRRSSDTIYAMDIYGARVSLNGVVLDSAGIPIDTSANEKDMPEVATITTDFQVSSLVVWEDYLLGVRGARVSEAGRVLDTAGIPIRPPRGGAIAGSPDITRDSANYLVAWLEMDTLTYYSTLYAARVAASGRVIDTAGALIFSTLNFSSGPASLFDGARYLLSFGVQNSLYCLRATPDLTSFDTTVITVGSGGPNYEDYSAAAYDGRNFLVAWSDDRNDYGDIYCTRVTPAGVNLDPQGIAVSNSPWTQMFTTVAFDGTNFLVAWCDGRLGGDTVLAIFAARVSQAGTVLDPDGILVSAPPLGTMYPNAIYDGVNFLLTWTGMDNCGYAARVSPAGVLLDTQAIALCRVSGGQILPTVASNGTTSLVAWSDMRNGSNYEIYGARIDHAGRVLDSNGIAIRTGSGDQAVTSVATNGQDFFVAWEDAPKSTYINICGGRVTAQGVVQDTYGRVIAMHVNSQLVPFVCAVFDGRNYVVAWPDSAHSMEGDIYGATISQAGAVLDTFPVANRTSYMPYLTLTRGTGMQTLCTYTVYTDTWQGKGYYVDRIWGKISAYSGVTDGSRHTALVLKLSASPNPCRGAATISYSLPKATRLSLKLYDVSGKAVTTLLEGKAQPGVSQFELRTSGLSRGVYVLRLDAGAQRLTRKLVID